MKYLIIVSMLSLSLVFAYNCQAKDYYDPGTKLGYGIAEAALCWMEVPLAIGYYSTEYDPISGIVVGTVVGTALAVRDCAEGTVNATFFLFPPYETKKRGILAKIKEWDKEFKERYW